MIKTYRTLLSTLAMAVLLTGCLAAESAQDYVTKARAHFDKSEWQLSQVQLRNAMRIDPKLAEAHYLQAELFEQAQNYRGMHGALEHVLSITPDHWDAGFDLAKVSLLMNEPDRAAILAEKALAEKPEDVSALVLMGTIRLQQKDPVASFKFAQQALTIAPTDPDAVTLMTHHWLNKFEFAKALQAVDASIAAHPDQRMLHLLGVSIASQQDDNAAVITRFNALIAQFPEELIFRNTLARIYINQENYPAARDVLAQSVEDLPDNVDAKLTYARFLAVESTEDAANSLTMYIDEGGEEQNDLRFLLADLFLKQGELDEATAVYQTISSEGSGEQAAQANNQLASLAMSRDDQATAEAMINKALETDPGNPRALLLRAHMKLLRRETDDAIADIRVVLRDEPSSAAAYSQLGRAYLQHSASDLAEQAFGNALTHDDQNAYAATELAKIYMARQDFNKAREVLVIAQTAHPSNTELTSLRVMTELALANYAQAQSLAASADPAVYGNSYQALIEGITLQAKGQYEEAIAAFQAILEADPNANRGVLEALAQSYQASGKPDALIAYLADLLAEHPESEVARELLAQTYRSQKRFPEAEQLVRDGLNDNWLKGYQLLAIVLVEQDRQQEALAMYEDIVTRRPDALGLRLQMASLAENVGETDRARELYEQILEQNPAIDVAANNLAMLLVKTDKLDEALVLARRFENSNVPYFVDTLGWIQHLNGNHAKALELFERALSITPNNAEMRYHAGVAYLALKREAQARENLELAVQLAGPDGTFDGLEEANRVLATLI